MPESVREIHGKGVEGDVDGQAVRIGRPEWILGDEEPPWAHRARRRADLDGSLIAFVSVDDTPVAALLFADRIRSDAPGMVRTLRADGMSRIVLVSGDRADLAESIGRIVGVDAVWAGQSPADKVAVVTEESARGPSIMVGDGINDAPALAAAGVGVALAARGATASSEAADVVLTVDRIDRLGEAVRMARSARRTATRVGLDRDGSVLHRDGRGRGGCAPGGRRCRPAGGHRRHRDPVGPARGPVAPARHAADPRRRCGSARPPGRRPPRHLGPGRAGPGRGRRPGGRC